MRIAIVTPYYNEDNETLIRCIDSVKAQTVKCSHIMVGDGGALSPASAFADEHIVLPKSCQDYGDTPRMIGATFAFTQGYDAMCWLDADNWFEPNHVEEMLEAVNLNPTAEIITATRNLRRPDGSLLGVCDESNGETFNDTNCYFILRSAMSIAKEWVFKNKKEAIIGDRKVWEAAKKFSREHVTTPTVNYTTMFGVHYAQRGENPPKGAKVILSTDGGENFNMVSWDEYLAIIANLPKQA